MSWRIPYIQHGRKHAPLGGSDKIPGVPRTVYGQIDGSGAAILDPGSGDWSLVTDDAGNWTITVDPPFTSAPTVVASENDTSTEPPNFVQAWGSAPDTILVQTYQPSTDVVVGDIGFNFIAVGPA